MSDRIQIHFAGLEQPGQFDIFRCAGGRFGLFSAFQFICPCLNLKQTFYDKRLLLAGFNDIPKFIAGYCDHFIVDSGLFTLMFGAHAGKRSEKEIDVWFNALTDFIGNYVPIETGSVVEVDCQKILGVEAAWKYRAEMRKRLPRHCIMNVFHLEDGIDGLYRLIDFSDYICFSIPELRIHIQPSKLKPFVDMLCYTAKSRKPSIRIHLLGCTEIKLLKGLERIATSSDSTSWQHGLRYGPKNNHQRKFDIASNDPRVHDIFYQKLANQKPRLLNITRDDTSKLKYMFFGAMLLRYTAEYYIKNLDLEERDVLH